jgi:Rrf2 family protein
MGTNSRFAVAVHTLTLMAWNHDQPLKSDEVAASVNTNPVVIRRLLCELAREGLVISQTGSTGGSRLAKQVHEITLLDVYQAVEGGRTLELHRHPPNPQCPVGVNISEVLEGVCAKVSLAIEGVLAKITLEDMVSQVRLCEKHGSVYDAEKPVGRNQPEAVTFEHGGVKS